MRERAYESAARERERALADSRDHLLSTLRMLEMDRVTLKAREARIAELEGQVEDFRQQLARLIARRVQKNRALVERKSRASPRPTSQRRAKRRPRSGVKRKARPVRR